jgi:hypothetical protein
MGDLKIKKCHNLQCYQNKNPWQSANHKELVADKEMDTGGSLELKNVII